MYQFVLNPQVYEIIKRDHNVPLYWRRGMLSFRMWQASRKNRHG